MPVAALLAASSVELKVASRTLTNIDRHYKFIAEQVASFAKWLTASLLAVNGGGVLAALDAIKEKHDTTLPAGLFIAGIIFALLSGAALQEVYNQVSNNLETAYQYWCNVKEGLSPRDAEQETKINKAENFWNRIAIIPPILGWISGALFLTGCIFMALRLSA